MSREQLLENLQERRQELIHYTSIFQTSIITFGDPYGNYSIRAVNAYLLDNIFSIVSEIKDNETASDLLKLNLVEYCGIYILDEDVYDLIDDGLKTLIEDLQEASE